MISGTFNNSGSIDVISLTTNNDVIYISESDNIYKTTNGGENWDNISSGLPNNIITDIVVDPNNYNKIWLTFSGYSNENKVYYSNDGGINWINICFYVFPFT